MLREQEQRLRLALDASAAGSWTWNAITSEVHWDERFRALYGFAPDEPADSTAWMPRVHEDDRAHVRAVLEASHCRWDWLVDVTVYLTDMQRDFHAYNGVWAEYFPDIDKAPCRTTLGITALPTPIAIELKCVAAFPETR